MSFEKVAPLRRRTRYTARHVQEQVIGQIKTGGANRTPYLRIRLSKQLTDDMQFLIGDSVDVYFDTASHEIAIFRNPYGDFVIRKIDGRNEKHGCQLKISNLPDLSDQETLTIPLTFKTDTKKNPSGLTLKLPAYFFTSMPSFVRLKAA